MLRLMSGAAVLLCVATAGAFSTGGTAQGAQSTLDASVVNRGVVELETGGSPDVSARIAEDIAGIVDDGATRRLVPVIGKGPLQNLTDLRYLRGIALAIVQSDVLDYARARPILPGSE